MPLEVKNYLKIIEQSTTYYQTYSLSFQHFILHNYYYSHWMILYFETPALHCWLLCCVYLCSLRYTLNSFLQFSLAQFKIIMFGFAIAKGWVKKNELALTDSGLYIWKEQEFKIVEEVWPTLFLGGGHNSSTILNSCSFQRYRPLSVKTSSFFWLTL